MNRLFRYMTYLAVLFVFAAGWLAPAADGAFLYKSYRVKIDKGREILCDPYIVRKNDYVLKLLRQKGEISAEDFPEFLNLFQRVNPHIRDIDLIRPGQQIFIPLRVLRSNEMPGQASGVVTIPYVTIGSPPEVSPDHVERYRVRRGDCVSKLITARFGAYGSEAYWEGVRLFQMLNPTVADLDLIYAGQTLRLPAASAKESPWYAETVGKTPDPPADSADAAQAAPAADAGGRPADRQPEKSPLQAAAEALGAELHDHGTYFFPRPGHDDFRLDLSRVPAMEFPDGWMVLLPDEASSDAAALGDLDPFPERVDTVPIAAEWEAARIVQAVLQRTGRVRPVNRLVVSDKSVRVEIHAKWITGRTIDDAGAVGRICIIPLQDCRLRTPLSIVRYLEEQDVLLREICQNGGGKSVRVPVHAGPEPFLRIEAVDRRSFVQELLTLLGCHYSPNVSISFPYAGAQIRAQSNLAAAPDGREFLVDFGDLYGDAIAAIERTGFSVVQIHQKDRRKILSTLLAEMRWKHRSDPTFMAADRPGPYNVAIRVSGFLVEAGEDRRVLFPAAAVHHRIAAFLQDRGIRIVEAGL